MAKYEWEFGDRVRAARRKAGLKQRELAKAMGITPHIISYWENGQRMPGVYNVYKLSKALNVSANYLVLGEE